MVVLKFALLLFFPHSFPFQFQLLMIHAYKYFYYSDCEEKTVSLVPRFLLTHAFVLQLFLFTKAPRFLKLLIPSSNAIGRCGDHCLNCRWNASWTETTDSCFTNCSTQNAFCSGVAIIALLRHWPREKRGAGLRMRTKLEHLLFRSMWGNFDRLCGLVVRVSGYRYRDTLHDLSRRAACGRSPAENLGSNPTGGMDICLLWVSCVVR